MEGHKCKAMKGKLHGLVGRRQVPIDWLGMAESCQAIREPEAAPDMEIN